MRMSVEPFEKAAARGYAACARDRRRCIAARARTLTQQHQSSLHFACRSHAGDNKSNLGALFACKIVSVKLIKSSYYALPVNKCENSTAFVILLAIAAICNRSIAVHFDENDGEANERQIVF